MSDYFQNKYRIDTHRVKGWDYRTPGWYFVTICTFDGICYFGEIQNVLMCLSEIGSIAWKYWNEIPVHHPHVKLGEFIVMPNHVHTTIRLVEQKNISKHDVETRDRVSLHGDDYWSLDSSQTQKFQKLLPGSVSVIINQFKGAVTHWCKNNHHGDFAWQPGFYDHIIRNSKSLHYINQYIQTNPENWNDDVYHPDNGKI